MAVGQCYSTVINQPDCTVIRLIEASRKLDDLIVLAAKDIPGKWPRMFGEAESLYLR
jgi:hypothetical protein